VSSRGSSGDWCAPSEGMTGTCVPPTGTGGAMSNPVAVPAAIWSALMIGYRSSGLPIPIAGNARGAAPRSATLACRSGLRPDIHRASRRSRSTAGAAGAANTRATSSRPGCSMASRPSAAPGASTAAKSAASRSGRNTPCVGNARARASVLGVAGAVAMHLEGRAICAAAEGTATASGVIGTIVGRLTLEIRMDPRSLLERAACGREGGRQGERHSAHVASTGWHRCDPSASVELVRALVEKCPAGPS
jgi:hypothetical protein